MPPSVSLRIGVLATAMSLAAAPLLVSPPSADAASRLACHASVSDSTPRQYSNVYVNVRTAPSARVRTVAHYKTTDTPHRTRANGAGRATVRYYISGATPGFRVWVSVTVTKNGRSNSCSTSFVPHR